MRTTYNVANARMPVSLFIHIMIDKGIIELTQLLKQCRVIIRDVTRLGLGGGAQKTSQPPPNGDRNKSFLHCCFGHHAPVIEGYLCYFLNIMGF